MLGEKEFTKLQGYIGGEYALLNGYNRVVANAIMHHYKPTGEGGTLPSDNVAASLALADKMDTICGILGIGMSPTGSTDPFAIRRNANGVVRIIDSFKYQVDLSQFIQKSFDLFGTKVDKKYFPSVQLFFKQRFKWFFQLQKFDYDVVDSVMHLNCWNLDILHKRVDELQKFKKDTDAKNVVLSFKRISNIIRDYSSKNRFEKTLLKEDGEVLFYRQFLLFEDKTKNYIAKK